MGNNIYQSKVKKSAFAFAFLLLTLTGFAQQHSESFDRKNAVYVELGGSGVWYSVNYEYRTPIQVNKRFALGGGISVIPVENSNLIGIVSANYLSGQKNIFELGISPAYIFTNFEFLISARIGYRYESSKGLLFRVGFSPVYGEFSLAGHGDGGKAVLPWGYLSVGYTF